MLFCIKKGKHRAKPFRFGLFFRKKTLDRRVTFLPESTYFIQGEDRWDINKLFGLSPFFVSMALSRKAMHHKESARFGWLYNAEEHLIHIYAYCYLDEKRNSVLIGKIPLQREVAMSITITDTHYVFKMEGFANVAMPRKNKKMFSYYLPLYFGGNQAAPGNVCVNIEKA